MAEDADGVLDEQVEDEVEFPELEDDDGAEGEVDEVEVEPEGEVTPEETDPEPDPEPEPDKVNVEKKVESLGYEVANLKKSLEDKLTEAVEKLKPAEPEDKTPDPLEELLSGGDEYDDPRVAKLAEQVKDIREASSKSLEELQSALRERDTYLNEIRADADRRKFSEANEDIADQYDTLIESARKELEPFANMNWTADTWAVMTDKVWSDVVNRAKSTTSTEPPPPSTEPDKPTKGTKVTHGGGTKSKTKESLDEELDRLANALATDD